MRTRTVSVLPLYSLPPCCPHPNSHLYPQRPRMPPFRLLLPAPLLPTPHPYPHFQPQVAVDMGSGAVLDCIDLYPYLDGHTNSPIFIPTPPLPSYLHTRPHTLTPGCGGHGQWRGAGVHRPAAAQGAKREPPAGGARGAAGDSDGTVVGALGAGCGSGPVVRVVGAATVGSELHCWKSTAQNENPRHGWRLAPRPQDDPHGRCLV